MKHQDQQVIGLRDPSQVSRDMIVTSPLAQFILPLMDGNQTVQQITEGAIARAKASNVPEQAVNAITQEPIQQLVGQLDGAGLLEGPRFDALIDKLQTEFDSNVNLPPSVSADFADALVMQDKGKEASDEDKAKLGPDKLRETFDAWIKAALDKAPDPSFDDLPQAVFVPDVDYPRGWVNYAHAYGRMRVCDRPDRVVILGVNHFGRSKGVALCDKGFESPLGVCNFDKALWDALSGALGKDDTAKGLEHRLDHEREHSIEWHIPWVNHVFGEQSGKSPTVFAALIHDPLRNSGQSYDGSGLDLEPFCKALGSAIDAVGGKTLIICSGSLSHIGPMFGDQHQVSGEGAEATNARNRMIEHDQAMLNIINQGKAEDLLTSMQWQQNPTRWSGLGPIVATLKVTGAANARTLNYAAAGDQQGMSMVSSFAGAIV
ncbi:MAG: AmmeMemoRadiSam system protein B [Phycisphaerales bacterium]|nr:AmmeMemoRadiSam system protein B [Phycisphaerales bacterium]